MKHSKVKSPNREELATLVHEIGGEGPLLAILRDFYERMSKDLMIGFFFEKHDLDHISTMQGKFILMASGLAKTFEGRGPSTAHTSLPPILSGHFDRRLVILRETLLAQGLNELNIQRWVQFEESFRSIVVADD
jgi:truncated hemoglobin YjbI